MKGFTMGKILTTILAIILIAAMFFVFAIAFSTSPEATLNLIRVGGKVFSIILLVVSVLMFFISIAGEDAMGPEKSESLYKRSIFGIILSMVFTTISILV